MGRTGYIVLAAAAVLLLLGVWRIAGTGEAPAPGANPGEVHSREDPTAPDLEGGSREGGGGDRTAPTPPVEAPPDPASDAEPVGVLRGVVVDGKNRPVNGAEVRAFREVPAGFEALLSEDEGVLAANARSAEGGKFELRIAAGRPHDVFATSPGLADAVVRELYAGEEATLVLRQGATLSGTVRRKQGLAPVAGARLCVRSANDTRRPPAWRGKTDETGRYVAPNLQPGILELLVLPESGAPESMHVVLAEGETRTLDITVGPGATVVGEVRDSESGAPIADAEVGDRWFRLRAKTDSAGRYELSGLVAEDDQAALLCARAPGFSTYAIEIAIQGEDMLRADFELVPGRSVRGRLVDRAGQPVADARIDTIADPPNAGSIPTRTASDGRFLLAGLRADLGYAVFARKPRFATSILRRVEAGAERETDLGDVVIPAGARLEGIVVNGTGDPLRSVQIVLSPPDCAGAADCLLAASSTSDGLGIFRLCDLAPGVHTAHVFAQGMPSKSTWTVALAEGEAKTGYRIVVEGGRSITGRVVDSDGVGIADVGVMITIAYPQNQGSSQTVTDANGDFQFRGLDERTYEISASTERSYGPPNDRHKLLDAVASDVRAGDEEVVLKLRRAAEIAGVVQGLPSDAAMTAFVLAVDADGARVGGSRVDAYGRFRVAVPAGELVELRAWKHPPSSILQGGRAFQRDPPPDVVRAGFRAGDPDVVLVVPP